MSGRRRARRLMPPARPSIVYARAAEIERLAHGYGRQGLDRHLELGGEIARRVERIADSLGRAV